MLTKILVMMLMWVVIGPIVLVANSVWCAIKADLEFNIATSQERMDKFTELFFGCNRSQLDEDTREIVHSREGLLNLLYGACIVWPGVLAHFNAEYNYAMNEMEKEYGTPTKEES